MNFCVPRGLRQNRLRNYWLSYRPFTKATNEPSPSSPLSLFFRSGAEPRWKSPQSQHTALHQSPLAKYSVCQGKSDTCENALFNEKWEEVKYVLHATRFSGVEERAPSDSFAEFPSRSLRKFIALLFPGSKKVSSHFVVRLWSFVAVALSLCTCVFCAHKIGSIRQRRIARSSLVRLKVGREFNGLLLYDK